MTLPVSCVIININISIEKRFCDCFESVMACRRANIIDMNLFRRPVGSSV